MTKPQVVSRVLLCTWLVLLINAALLIYQAKVATENVHERQAINKKFDEILERTKGPGS